ncbi:GntR family transcriptional regulator [Salicibibacter halophilus]|uniref:GntR family transcriptional regulator n=1 Tax=Salicibibacter halophilus TaxID=2502791 RepID=A0A514LJ64_9BACI|nr:GntR family transcriptional regulator [Salicibibacter halophilus]QDI91894.1 GntR family transcriptional regulator [Salicibibacter halophilus]
MILNSDELKPIYIQISKWIEGEILNGVFGVDEKVYSQYTLAEMFNINPATAAKGLTKLAEEDILYDKRGLGKFVANDAREKIIDKRKNHTLKRMLKEIVQESERLEMGEEELIMMLKAVKKGEDEQ